MQFCYVMKLPFKELLVYAEETACHGGTANSLCSVWVSRLLVFGHRVPVELQVPVETTHIDTPTVPVVVLKGVIVNHIDDRADHVGLVPRNPVQQRLQPALGALTVRIKVCDHRSRHMSGSQQSSSNQADSLTRPNHLHLGQASSPVVKVLLEVVHRAGIINQHNLERVEKSFKASGEGEEASPVQQDGQGFDQGLSRQCAAGLTRPHCGSTPLQKWLEDPKNSKEYQLWLTICKWFQTFGMVWLTLKVEILIIAWITLRNLSSALHQSSLGSGRDRWTEILSLTYWLNALSWQNIFVEGYLF